MSETSIFQRAKHGILSIVLCMSFAVKSAEAQKIEPITLKWLGGKAPQNPIGVSWGVPFGKGQIKPGQSLTLSNLKGEKLPLQSWTLAYWPDGSVKWLGLATVAGGESAKTLQLSSDNLKKSVDGTLKIAEKKNIFEINTGILTCQIPKKGTFILDSLKLNGKLVANAGRLMVISQDGPDAEDFNSPVKHLSQSEITSVKIEQSGPVRAVVHIEGMHRTETENKSWLPFHVRLYFYAGQEHIRMVHSFIFDGDDQKDFIRGLGVFFNVPMKEQMHNRHVRFSGQEDGIWAEPVKVLTGRRVLKKGDRPVYEDQFLGKPLPNQEEFDEKGQNLIKDWANWNDYKLMQNSADGFTIQKRTNSKSAWIDAGGGKRASGLGFVGDISGGLGIAVKNFWKSYPAALEIRNATSSNAELRAWLWSPYAEAMDLRHYDTTAHGLEASYEDVQKGFSTANGVARTSELMLFPSREVPSHELLAQQAQFSNQPPLLACTPEYLHSVSAFGIWSLPDRSTAGKRWIEGELDKAISFYQKEVEQRHWYGFWNYGDVMHAYDSVRHTWRYDVGGFAWANTELVPDMWLWYSYLRSGDADIFRMAEAMTRHTSEVDVYHLGKFAGLGSRHNVRHWGCGSKEVRISQAALKRFYYYLTTDERTGDLMEEVANADDALVKTDPLRLILPPSKYPTHARVGPDWIALVGNWMTQWERTGEKKWLDKINAGIGSFATMPYGFYSGVAGAFGYDPKDSKMYQLNPGDLGVSHLTTLMGGAEIGFELSKSIDNPDWQKLWLQYCELYGAPKEEVKRVFGKEQQLETPGTHFSRLPAYASYVKKDKNLAKKAWNQFLKGSVKQFETKKIEGSQVLNPIQEIPAISTNNTAQWCLNAIELLELIGKDMPDNNPLWNK